MSSYRTIKPKNGAPTKTATDIHITTVDPGNPQPNSPKLNVKGVDGKAPSDPNASYGLDGDGTNSIDITGINVGTGGELNIRLESDAKEFPKLWYRWTPESEFGTTATEIALTGSTPASKSVALAALDQIIR
jgi:hypothetical protein